MDKTVSKFYHKIQFPGHYTQKEVVKKSEDFFLAEYMKLKFLPFKGKLLEAGRGDAPRFSLARFPRFLQCPVTVRPFTDREFALRLRRFARIALCGV